MSQRLRRIWQRCKPLWFVLAVLLCWGVLASASALILRLIYGAFMFCADRTYEVGSHRWLPTTGFEHWHWFFKGLFLGATLIVALGVTYKVAFPSVDASGPTASS